VVTFGQDIMWRARLHERNPRSRFLLRDLFFSFSFSFSLCFCFCFRFFGFSFRERRRSHFGAALEERSID